MKILPLLLFALLSACAATGRQPSSTPTPDKATFQRNYAASVLKKWADSKGSALVDADFQPRNCDGDGDHGPSCLQAICNLGSYDCKDYQSVVQQVNNLCQEGVDADCVRDTCALGSYDCKNYQSVVQQVVGLCKGLDSGCLGMICGLGSYDCKNYQSVVQQVVALCQGGVDSRCVRDTCALGSYDCKNYQSTVQQVIGMCKRH